MASMIYMELSCDELFIALMIHDFQTIDKPQYHLLFRGKNSLFVCLFVVRRFSCALFAYLFAYVSV